MSGSVRAFVLVQRPSSFSQRHGYQEGETGWTGLALRERGVV